MSESQAEVHGEIISPSEELIPIQDAAFDLLRVNYMGKLMTAEETAATILEKRIKQAEIIDNNGAKTTYGEIIKTDLSSTQAKISDEFHTKEQSKRKISETLDAIAKTMPLQKDSIYSKSDLEHALWKQVAKIAAWRKEEYLGQNSLARENQIVIQESGDQEKINEAKNAKEVAKNASIVARSIAEAAQQRLEEIEEQRKRENTPPAKDLTPVNMKDLQEPNAEWKTTYEIDGLHDKVPVEAFIENKAAKTDGEGLIMNLVQTANKPSRLTNPSNRRALAELLGKVTQDLYSDLPTASDDHQLLRQPSGNFRKIGEEIRYSRGDSDDMGLDPSEERTLYGKLTTLAVKVKGIS